MLLTFAVLFALSARPSRVEAMSPMPPTPVVADGKRVLAYELHITNFDPQPLVLEHVDVNGTDYSGDTLKKMLQPVCKSADVARIDPGCRVIVFFWIALPLDEPVPASLRHQLVFDTSKIDDIIVPIRHGTVPLLTPFASGGEWYAGNGPSNGSDHRRTIIALGGRATMSQRFAIDWAKIGKNGNTFHDSRDRNENFWGFGEPVHAVADGEVTEAVDEFPDNHPDVLPDPVTPHNIVGNHVIVRIAPDVYVAYCHLKSHSVRVHLHDKVKRGAVIGEIGNSGQSTGAHLHLQVMNANSALVAEGIPYLFDRFHFLGWGKDFEEDKPHPNEPRRNEMPVNDEVVSFP